jgi:hypothetical protein
LTFYKEWSSLLTYSGTLCPSAFASLSPKKKQLSSNPPPPNSKSEGVEKEAMEKSKHSSCLKSGMPNSFEVQK